MGHVTGIRWAIKLGIVLLASVLVHSVRAETFVVGYYSGGAPPFYFKDGDSRQGIYDKLLEALSSIMHDTFTVKYATPARIKQDFGKRYDIEMGINPAWRPDQKSISVYTKPFLRYTDVVVMRKEKSFSVNNIEDLQGKKVGIIRGYIYPGWMPKEGGYIPDKSTNDSMLFKKFKANRYDILLSGMIIAKYYAKELGLDIVFDKQISAVDIYIRLHISKESSVNRLDKALDNLMGGGNIEAIIREYTE